LTALGADLGAIAKPWRSFAFEPFTVGPGVPVPPFPAVAMLVSAAGVARHASTRIADNLREGIRSWLENIARSPSSARGWLAGWRCGGLGSHPSRAA
jgi:hypothetical protein